MKNKLGSVDVKLMVAVVRAFQDGKLVVEEGPDRASPTEQPAGTPGPESPARRSTSDLPAEKQLAVQEGGRLFQKTCAMCHGRDGKGAIARDSLPSIPDFTLRPWQQKRTNPQLVVSILDGKGTGMPAFRDKIARERARDIVSYIRAFAPGSTPEAASSSNDFEVRFNKLAQEFDDIARRIRALSATAPAGGTTPDPMKAVPKK